jgi:quercetin dioxygenase-like cupin family protein
MDAWQTLRGAMLIAGSLTFAFGGDTSSERFISIPASEIRWQPNPTVPGSQVAILIGDPAQAGPLVIRVRFTAPAQIMPHTHPDSRTYTVLAGEWKLGFGTRYEAARLQTYGPGSVYRLPAGIAHFQASGAGETIVQIESVGPTSTDFLPAAANP